jgi:hypothetical protein
MLKPVLCLLLIAFTTSGSGRFANWISWSPPDGSFSMLLPGHPTQVPQPGRMRVYTVTQGSTEYQIIYDDVHVPDEHDARNLLDGLVTDVQRRLGGTIRSDVPVMLDGYFGRALVITAKGKLYHDHMYVIQQRLYQIATISGTGQDSPDTEYFLDSFVLPDP